MRENQLHGHQLACIHFLGINNSGVIFCKFYDASIGQFDHLGQHSAIPVRDKSLDDDFDVDMELGTVRNY